MKQNVSQINGGITNNKFWCGCKKYHICDIDYVWNPATFSCENWKYLASVMNDSAIICDEVIKPYDGEIQTMRTKFNKNNLVKHKSSIFWWSFC